MLKVAIQILLITFILILCYDTIDICLNQINSKQESELLIVKREIEETKQQVETITPYETYEFPVWPIALGFSCAFCSVVCHFILPSSGFSAKRVSSKGKPHHSRSKLNRNKRNYKKEDEFNYFEEIDKKDDSKHCFDITIKDEVVYCKDLGLITSQEASPENDSKIGSLAQLNEGQVKSIMNVCIPNLFHDEMLPAQSSLNVMNNTSLSPSMTSLDHLDCSNSNNLYTMLLENKSISKMGLPSTPRSFYGEDNSRRKQQFSKTFYEKNCEILTVNKTVFEENSSHKSEDSNDSVSIKQGQIMGLFSMSNNDFTKPPQKTTSDKSINVHLLTYNGNDLKNIEKRLENIEFGLRRSEEKTKDWGNRINVAETELVDLHEQMYTIFSKFEEEKKTNYIIVSKVSKDKIFPKDRDTFDTVAEESDEFELVKEKRDDDISMNKINEETASAPNPESDLAIQKDSSEEESEDELSVKDSKSNDEENQQAIDDSTKVILTELKQRSIALEALLESKSRSQISPYLPKKKIPQLNVPPHVIPPYKRSSFAGTDTKPELRKRRRKLPKSGNEFFWRTKM